MAADTVRRYGARWSSTLAGPMTSAYLGSQFFIENSAEPQMQVPVWVSLPFGRPVRLSLPMRLDVYDDSRPTIDDPGPRGGRARYRLDGLARVAQSQSRATVSNSRFPRITPRGWVRSSRRRDQPAAARRRDFDHDEIRSA